MNAAQRKYLIEQIEGSAKAQCDALRNGIPEEPSLANYLLHAVMSGNFRIKNTEAIKKIILDKALNATAGSENWLAANKGTYSAFGSKENVVVFKTKDLFEIPEEYKIKYAQYREEKEALENEIHAIHMKEKGLITRITLASDKTLQRMINEVDDMGDLSLVDDSLKLGFTGGESQKLLS